MEKEVEQELWKELEPRVMSLIVMQEELINEILKSAKEHYPIHKIPEFRLLFIGFLRITNYNLKATRLLIENNLLHQVNYINRNMFEMVVCLFYLDNVGRDINPLAIRFFEYHAVTAYKFLKIIENDPDALTSMKRIPENEQQIKEDYKSFIGKYGKNAQSWSGKTLPQMIEDINDINVKKTLMEYYNKITQLNNKYLHPSVTYLSEVLLSESESIDYSLRVMQLDAMFIAAYLLIDVYFKRFSKGRIKHKHSLDIIMDEYKALNAYAKEKGI